MRRAAATLLLLTALGVASADELPGLPAAPAAAEGGVLAQRSDSYDVTWKGVGMGRGTISLTPLDAGCYRLRSTTTPIALARWLYGSPSETSEFCVVDGQVRPNRFAYVLDDGAHDNFTLDFDWSRNTVKSIKGSDVRVRDLTGPAYDRFVMQVVIRQWVSEHAGDEGRPEREFTMVDDKQIRAYRFAIVGRETVTTPAGRFSAVRVERTDNPKKSSRFWLAPERNWAPVRIEQIDRGKQQVLMELRS